MFKLFASIAKIEGLIKRPLVPKVVNEGRNPLWVLVARVAKALSSCSRTLGSISEGEMMVEWRFPSQPGNGIAEDDGRNGEKRRETW